jgi:hypothetical protein
MIINKSAPKLMHLSTKAISARQEYRDFLKQKAKEYAEIETKYYTIKNSLEKAKKTRIEGVLTTNDEGQRNYQTNL